MPGRPATLNSPPPPGARGCLPGFETAQLPSQLLQLPQSWEKPGPPQPGRQAPPRLSPPPSVLVTGGHFCVSSSEISTTTGRQGAWAEAGLKICFVWPSTALRKNLNWLPTLKSQISHKNPDFWLLWTNQESLAAPDPYSQWLQYPGCVCLRRTHTLPPSTVPTTPCCLTPAPSRVARRPPPPRKGAQLPTAPAFLVLPPRPLPSPSTDVLPTLQGPSQTQRTSGRPVCLSMSKFQTSLSILDPLSWDGPLNGPVTAGSSSPPAAHSRDTASAVALPYSPPLGPPLPTRGPVPQPDPLQ